MKIPIFDLTSYVSDGFKTTNQSPFHRLRDSEVNVIQWEGIHNIKEAVEMQKISIDQNPGHCISGLDYYPAFMKKNKKILYMYICDFA